MNKTLLAIIFAIFLMLGIACVCAVELQSTSGYCGNNHDYYLADLSKWCKNISTSLSRG